MVCPAAFNREHHCLGRPGSEPQVWPLPGCTAVGHCVCACVCVWGRICVEICALVCLWKAASDKVSEWRKMTLHVSGDENEAADSFVLIHSIRYSLFKMNVPSPESVLPRERRHGHGWQIYAMMNRKECFVMSGSLYWQMSNGSSLFYNLTYTPQNTYK